MSFKIFGRRLQNVMMLSIDMEYDVLEVCTLIIGGHYLKNKNYLTLKSVNNIHFKTNFFFKWDSHFET